MCPERPSDLQTTARRAVIARNRNQNTFAKRQREQDKKRKAEDKRARRLRRKEAGSEPPQPFPQEHESLPLTDTGD